jgi:Phosphotransferase enzyme family
MVLRQPSLLFPPADSGVLLPCHDKECAALGITMYTASRPAVLLAQRAAFRVARAIGVWALRPKPAELVIDEWEELTRSWGDTLGPVQSIAMYQRKDPRGGMTMLVSRPDLPPVLVKCRRANREITVEQRMLAAMQDRDVPGIAAPRPIGAGVTQGSLSWAAQEFVFSRPHRPVFALEPAQLDALGSAIEEIVTDLGLEGSAGKGMAAAHGDLAPWNLRRDHRGQVWLIDWEDVCFAPCGADAGYLLLTAAALRGTKPESLSPPVVAFWTEAIERRISNGHSHPINHAILDLLREMSR